MTAGRWREVKRLFDAVVDCPAEERRGFLERESKGDQALRREVETLLAAHAQAGPSFLGRRPSSVVTREVEADPTATEAGGPGRVDLPAFAAEDRLCERFRIVRFVARGGMGEVYEAEDLQLGECVALKTVRAEVASDARALGRFKREIRLARRVTHPNVCRVFDLFEHRGSDPQLPPVVFFTMELLPGETLSRRIARAGTLSIDEVQGCLREMALALDAAHQAGVIHRDFKAANVILVPDPRAPRKERAVVTDFGLARGSSGSDAASFSGSLRVVGTPAYMAPEQIWGGEVTAAADIYALGVVLYEMVTGRRPHDDGPGGSSGAARLITAPTPASEIRSELGSRWDRAIGRCLERDPAARFQSTLELLDGLGIDRRRR